MYVLGMWHTIERRTHKSQKDKPGQLLSLEQDENPVTWRTHSMYFAVAVVAIVAVAAAAGTERLVNKSSLSIVVINAPRTTNLRS